MANRPYNQYCAIAHTLDIVGDRWCLLLIRNMMTGPKRFTDLLHGLPGISSNTMAERLKVLGERGVVTRREIPPPVATYLYALTDLGYDLMGTLSALAEWGGKSLGAPQEGQRFLAESAEFMILDALKAGQPDPPELHLVIHVQDALDERHFDVQLGPHLHDNHILVEEAEVEDAALRITTALEPLMQWSTGQLSLSTARESGQIVIEGDPAGVETLLKWVD
ncbi:MAG: helix-turn-helix transcriptional regulator [Chloroflexi bacterium]|nr:helix-turn-helix transcriptional regulator [Chloroflexota bacterium]